MGPTDRRRAARVLGALVATLASAVLYGLSFPPAALRPLAWVALVPWFTAVRRVSLGAALLLSWLWTLVAAYVVGDWFPRAVSHYYQQPGVVGLGFFVGVSSLMAAAYYMAFAVAYRVLVRRPGGALPLVVGTAWVAIEFGRVQLLTGNPWALLGYSQAGLPTLLQVADATGVYGVSFVLAATNAALAEAWEAHRRPWRERAHAARGLAATGAAVVLLVAYGAFRMASAPAGAGAVPVSVVQGNLDLGSQWMPEHYGQNLDAYLTLTHRSLRERKARVVFWPESAMTFFLDAELSYQRAIGALLEPFDAELVAGGPRAGGEEAEVYYNSAFLLSPDGRVLAAYDKEDLLPFAEYFPVDSLDFMRRRFGRVREFTGGAPTPPLPTVAGPAGILICNEAMFPALAAARVRAGADYLVNLANDTWLGDPKFAEIMFETVSLRAVEQRRYLVRASTAGPSGIVDPFGRVLARTQSFTQATLAGEVRPGGPVTLYCRVGDAFAVLCTLIALGALARRARQAVADREHAQRAA
jgi:apolipoprotein N-acyltransferase